MIIKLSPARSGAALVVTRDGDKLTINGTELDFSPLPEGATLPADAINCDWIAGPVDRVDGRLVITITMPHGPDAGTKSRFPADINNPPSGRVLLPTDLDPKPAQEQEA